MMGTRLLAGRDFNARDNDEGQKVSIVNESMACYFFVAATPSVSTLIAFANSNLQPLPPYSQRSASIGSIAVARRAGR